MKLLQITYELNSIIFTPCLFCLSFLFNHFLPIRDDKQCTICTVSNAKCLKFECLWSLTYKSTQCTQHQHTATSSKQATINHQHSTVYICIKFNSIHEWNGMAQRLKQTYLIRLPNKIIFRRKNCSNSFVELISYSNYYYYWNVVFFSLIFIYAILPPYRLLAFRWKCTEFTYRANLNFELLHCEFDVYARKQYIINKHMVGPLISFSVSSVAVCSILLTLYEWNNFSKCMQGKRKEIQNCWGCEMLENVAQRILCASVIEPFRNSISLSFHSVYMRGKGCLYGYILYRMPLC